MPSSEDECSLLARARREADPAYQDSRITSLLRAPGLLSQSDFNAYIGPIRSENVGGRGRGLIASSDLPAGSLVLLEPATIATPPGQHQDMCDRGEDTDFSLFFETMARLRAGGEGARALRDRLCCLHPSPDEVVSVARDQLADMRIDASELPNRLPTGMSLADVRHVERVANRNAFTLTSPPGMMLRPELQRLEGGSGLFLFTSLFNHSCEPNCVWSVVAGVAIVRCVRDVREGEELTISYVDLEEDPCKRYRSIEVSIVCSANMPFGISCVCGR